MERMIRLQVERLEEGGYVATSQDVQGLVVEAETVPELLKLVPDIVALIEEIRAEHGFGEQVTGSPVPSTFDIPFVLAA